MSCKSQLSAARTVNVLEDEFCFKQSALLLLRREWARGASGGRPMLFDNLCTTEKQFRTFAKQCHWQCALTPHLGCWAHASVVWRLVRLSSSARLCSSSLTQTKPPKPMRPQYVPATKAQGLTFSIFAYLFFFFFLKATATAAHTTVAKHVVSLS